MKRNEFLRTAALLSGSTLWSCEKLIIDNVVEPLKLSNIDLNEARQYFENIYLPRFQDELVSPINKDRYQRRPNWALASRRKNTKNKDYIVVPINYEDEKRPAIVIWTDSTSFINKLAKYYYQPIVEVLIILKEDSETKVFLAQVAVDIYDVKIKNKKTLSISNFTGTLVSTDWNDSPINGLFFKDGAATIGFSNKTQSKARPSDCRTFTISWQTVTMATCGPACAEATLHRWQKDHTICATDPESVNRSNYENGYYNSASFQSDGVFSGGQAFSYNTNYNLQTVLINPYSNDRALFNSNLSSVMTVTGLITDIHAWNLDVANALARSVGGDIGVYFPLAERVGKVIGRASLAISATQFVMGIVEDGFSLEGDGVNLAQVLLGVGALYAAPWGIVVIGGISLIIAVGSMD